MSQINTSRAQVLGVKLICFAYRMEKDKMGGKNGNWGKKKNLCFRVVSSSLGS